MTIIKQTTLIDENGVELEQFINNEDNNNFRQK